MAALRAAGFKRDPGLSAGPASHLLLAMLASAAAQSVTRGTQGAGQAGGPGFQAGLFTG